MTMNEQTRKWQAYGGANAIAAVKALYEDRENIPNIRIVWGHNLPMRHFHAFLEPYPNK